MSTMYDQMLEVVKYYEQNQPLKKVTNTVYKDKKSQAELTSDAELLAAFKTGKSISDFEVITETVDPKAGLIKMVFGDEKPKHLQVSKFFKIVGEITGANITLPTEAKSAKKVTASPFEIKKRAANAKIQNVKNGKNKSVTLDVAKAELLAVYTEYGKVYNPRKK